MNWVRPVLIVAQLVMAKNVTMKVLAERLGMAASTVSRALKDDRRIAETTRQRVQALAQELGYRPNPMVSSLMATRNRSGQATGITTIAVVTDYRGSRSWREKDVCQWAYTGIVQRASELGYQVSVFSLQDYGYDVQRLEKTLMARGIRGILLGFSRNEDANLSFTPGYFAITGLSTYFRHMQVDRANFYGFYNVRLALEKLRGYGYRRPALVVPEFNNAVSDHAWSAAYLDWQRRLPTADRCPPFIPQVADEGAAFKDWLKTYQPDALLVYKVPVRHYLTSMGLRVPEQIGLAYLYRNADEMGMTAGIDGRMHLVGAAALDLVVEKLQRNLFQTEENAKDVLIKGAWIHGPTLKVKQPAEPVAGL